MKIKEINTYFVRPRWGFVEIITDQGLSGWGEAVLEGHAGTVLACVHEMEDYLIGADPAHIEDIWTVLYRAGFYRGGGVMMSAISGIDQALWDIKGKYFNAPVHELMGGSCRNKMRVYSWIGGDRPTDVGAAAREKMEAGFTAVKMNATEELQFIDSYDKIDAVLERVVSNISLRHRATFRKRHIWRFGSMGRCKIHCKIYHTYLRAISMTNHNFVALFYQIYNRFRRFFHQLNLFLRCLSQCVTAQSQYNTFHDSIHLKVMYA